MTLVIGECDDDWPGMMVMVVVVDKDMRLTPFCLAVKSPGERCWLKRRNRTSLGGTSGISLTATKNITWP